MNRETKRAMARQKTADPQRLQQLRKQQLERQRTSRDGQQGARHSRLRGIGSFGGEVVAELRKVNWPAPRQAANMTAVIVALSAALGVFLGAVDFSFQELFRLMLQGLGAAGY